MHCPYCKRAIGPNAASHDHTITEGKIFTLIACPYIPVDRQVIYARPLRLPPRSNDLLLNDDPH